jgi:G3E family GTPase
MTKKIAINIIMGFLGVGKTTAILHLLKQKPAEEKWAVLVNEFGEVGIDGAILSAESGMTVSEVPGGCLCCVSGIPFQAALSNLIAQQQPDRILIEPTGLGHPKNLMRTLISKSYQDYVELKASICLLDSRQLKNPKYQQHETFNDQCLLADVLVANKIDLSSKVDEKNFYQFAQKMVPKKSQLGWVENGQLDLAWLDVESDQSRQSITAHKLHSHKHSHQHSDANSDASSEQLMGPVKLESGQTHCAFENEGMGYFSIGWLLAQDQIFEHQALSQWLMTLDVERVKGLFITNEGAYVMNLREQVFSEMPTRSLLQSRIEIIHSDSLDKQTLEQDLLACLVH